MLIILNLFGAITKNIAGMDEGGIQASDKINFTINIIVVKVNRVIFRLV